jgi:hypothetical protein
MRFADFFTPVARTRGNMAHGVYEQHSPAVWLRSAYGPQVNRHQIPFSGR